MSELNKNKEEGIDLNNSFEVFINTISKVTYQKTLTRLTFTQLDLYEKELENHDIILKTTDSNKNRINGTISTTFNDFITDEII